MGIDLMDISFRLEKNSGVKMSRDDWPSLVRDNDIMVGDLYSLLICRSKLSEDLRADMELNESVWFRVQSAVAGISGKEVSEINLGISLNELFPMEERREQWEALRKELDLSTPSLENTTRDQRWISTGWLMRIAVPTILLASGCFSFPFFSSTATYVMEVIGCLLSCAVVNAIQSTLVRRYWEPRRTNFPDKMLTLKEFCRRVRDINAHRLMGRRVSQDLDEGLRLWESLKVSLIDALGVEESNITMQARLVKDLGAE